LARAGLDERRKFKDKKFMEDLFRYLQDEGFEITEIRVREEDGYHEFKVSNGPGVTHEFLVDWGFISSPELRQIISVSPIYRDLTSKPFAVSFDGERIILRDPEELVTLLLDRGKKGLTIQRYKGLGEMNPEQLWATTMDPERRNLLQIRIEDGVEADEVFTILMGDKVEPRRAFIQNNALEVRELDI
jgi:DNA gyrase subunit B